MDSTITSLENALAASRDEDWRIALGHLLAAWQITPAREVLAAFDAVDPRARETTWTVAGRDPDELAHAWLHAITDADAALFGVLCDNFEACGRGQHVRMLAAAQRMASHPRFGELLVRRPKRRARRLHGYWSPLPENLAYWPPFEAAAHASRDPRVPELLREYEDANGRVDRHAVPPPIAWPTLDDRSRAICARIVELAPQLRTKRDRDLAAHAMLLEAIYQAPGDPGPKLAFADFLQQRGDPRGELVALQLTASPGRWLKRTRQRRMDAILQTFWRDLKAPAPITAGVVFRDGFPARIRMGGPLGDEPAWRLIRSADEAPIGELSMPLLEELENLTPESLERLARRKTPLPVRRMKLAPGRARWIDGDRMAAFRAITCLPALRELELTNLDFNAVQVELHHYQWLFDAPCSQQLETLILQLPTHRFMFTELAVAVRGITHIKRLVLEARTPDGMRWTFRRSRAGELSSLAIEITEHRPAEAVKASLRLLAALPPDMLQYLRVSDRRGVAETFREVAARQTRLRRLHFNGARA